MIDAIDRQILLLLQENCRFSNASLAEHVGLTASAVYGRVKKMEKSGIIKSYVALVDGNLLDKPLMAFIRLKISSIYPNFHEAKERITEACLVEPDVLECHGLAGEDDYILKVRVANSKDLEMLIERIRSKAPISSSVSNIVLSAYKESPKIELNGANIDSEAKPEGDD